MTSVATFSKVSYEQFEKDWAKTYIGCGVADILNETKQYIRKVYDGIVLPNRATIGSAGYDFHLPSGFTLKKDSVVKIPTGIRCEIASGWLLTMYPRSSHGFKYGIHMANTVGIIDSDYAYADNEGHIFVELVNDSCLKQDIHFETGDAFCQGVFLPYGVTFDDDVNAYRTGGFGSTGR